MRKCDPRTHENAISVVGGTKREVVGSDFWLPRSHQNEISENTLRAHGNIYIRGGELGNSVFCSKYWAPAQFRCINEIQFSHVSTPGGNTLKTSARPSH